MNQTANAPQSNELNVVKSKILSLVASLENIEDERDQMKSVLENLKAEHGIAPKVSRKVAKIIHKDALADLEKEYSDLKELLDKVK